MGVALCQREKDQRIKMPGELSQKVGIFNIFIVSKSGGLIYHYDNHVAVTETEKTFGYPLDIKLELEHKRVAVVFGERDGIRIGHSLLSVNGVPVVVSNGRAVLENDTEGKDVFQMINEKESYPLNLKFGRPKTTTNEKIVLASMFYPLYALAVQLSPDQGSSGIQELETDTFKLYCTQTVTGVKFLIVCDPKQMGVDQLLEKIYELYADFALKNPFYSLEMPIRADLFDSNLQVAIDQIERTGFI